MAPVEVHGPQQLMHSGLAHSDPVDEVHSQSVLTGCPEQQCGNQLTSCTSKTDGIVVLNVARQLQSLTRQPVEQPNCPLVDHPREAATNVHQPLALVPQQSQLKVSDDPIVTGTRITAANPQSVMATRGLTAKTLT